MKILWVVNTIFPDAAKHLGLEQTVYGGWMYGLAADLAKVVSIKLGVATVYSGSSIKSFSINGIQYYLIPREAKGLWRKSSKVTHWNTVVNEFTPDIVHIHGTEYGHGMDLINSCPNLKFIVSLQGLVSVYHRYYLAGMSTGDVLRNITFRDIVRWDNLFLAKQRFYKRGLVETEYLRRANAVIGRTDWDRIHANAINPSIKYHFCNESLRDEFYSGESWSLEKCRRYSIFLSQASYPIKGLHQVLKAVALLKNEYPEILVNVTGYDITRSASLKDRVKRGGYGRYIGKLIRDLGLEKHVVFLGQLPANEMKREYLQAHTFICPSSIENSPNSLGEAQILGVPCISSYCGGIPSMVKDGVSAVLYSFDEYEMLASHIKKIFASPLISSKLSSNGSIEASSRHDRKRNLDTLKTIYEEVRNC